ncbi:MAG TPA: pseudouridine synthase [Ktedonobacterales bacterium]|jgi:pseudouridine synthase
MADTAGAENERQRGERLQKYLAHAGIASRRHAEELIEAGAVSVNGAIVRELGVRVDPASDEVRVRGRLVRPAATHLYILLNKPAETVTTAHDPQRRRTVLDLLPAEWVAQRVYPVGRLDVDTEGLLLLTNDGEMALRLTHPRYALTKEYEALVENRPSAAAMTAITKGMMLPGETRPTAPARAWIIDETTSEEGIWLGIELHEGRKRQVRRMLAVAGLRVLELRRVRVGPLKLGLLKLGASRLLTAKELAALRKAVGME